jgi:mRNA-degrading endonuclease RelE of RelBE toxin-antitoxin system
MNVKEVKESDDFKKAYQKLDNSIRLKLDKILLKIINNPELGKPMMYTRKGTRELYVKPFRLSYGYDYSSEILYLLNFYHKDEQ